MTETQHTAPPQADRPRPRPRPGGIAGAIPGAGIVSGAVSQATEAAGAVVSQAAGAVGQATAAVPGIPSVPGIGGLPGVGSVPGLDKAVDLVKDNPVGEVAKAATAGGLPKVGAGDVVGFSGLARFGASSLWRALNLAAKGTVDSGRELVKEVQSGEPITEIIDNRVEAVRSAAWNALGLKDQTEELLQGDHRHSSYRDLRTAGDRLLERSCDSANQARNEHPAFVAILQELDPDEARILRFLAVAGPQPAIDVRTKTPFGVGSERLAGGINMIADMAGCTFPDRNQQYLANLNRLGMVRFSEEQVDDPRRYSLIEAQPSAAAAMAKAKKSVTVYRSIYLSLFGKQFCEVCFTMEGYDAGGWIRDVR